MLDRLAELLAGLQSELATLEALEAASDDVEGSAQAVSLLEAVWLQDLQRLLEWGNKAHDLKFMGLVYPPGTRGKELTVAIADSRNWEARLTKLISDAQRRRVRVVSPSVAVSKPLKRKR